MIEPTLPEAELARPYGGRDAPAVGGAASTAVPRKRTALGAPRRASGPKGSDGVERSSARTPEGLSTVGLSTPATAPRRRTARQKGPRYQAAERHGPWHPRSPPAPDTDSCCAPAAPGRSCFPASPHVSPSRC
ncbi:hypothetical protein FNV62_23480 [Streptomyces sp. RLB3-17]|nr:hypothetical protein FNV67_25610 [Streptomyces sp. S1D4-20]QDN68349.1 hypothetical protein FNV66_24800 [Streptomyces sp. S1D4-14]QDN88334.1 hypothetical protein FNV61_24435 [Streptomyces sp. RLB3-6]QDN98966.1 hypothetical protein FNV58_25865 [Streptomyces sp. RLB1-9]QDO20679.1 hypothetical protein FNV65_24360 [Streptomyces sp. S1A1-8]QDO30805.1 hypothetical protein FNV63_24380 [Streptomyces sp. S1A1-3]QDO40719.1 hypothetical protein FNV62_23480 [Streptomyces sp. RLB3-17]QDO50767.1 hypothe